MTQEQMAVVEELLDYTVQFINEFEELKRGSDSGKYKKIVEELMKRRMVVAREGIEYLEYFKEVFQDDILLHTLVLSVLFFVFQEKNILEQLDELLCSEKIPYDVAIGIRQQLAVIRFRKMDLDITYEEKRNQQSLLIERFGKMVEGSIEKIPYQQRNHKCIVVATDRLLSKTHAPTRIVLGVAKCLQQQLGYKVVVVSDIEQANTFEMEKYWFCPYTINYKSEYNGKQILQYEGCELFVYQQIVDTLHIKEVCDGLQYIASLKPECVWYIGGDSVIRDLYAKMTTLIAMPCTTGYAASDAQVLASYMMSHTEKEECVERYIALHGQKKIKMELVLPRKAEGKLYQKEELGFKKEAFVIVIAGNRLDEEVTEKFQNIMCEIIERDRSVYYAIIGNRNRSWKKELSEHIVELGYREDFVEVMSCAQLFLNPVRKGGGGGADVALRCNIPVVTLPDCDVANLAGDAFVCDDIQDIPMLVERYCKDKVFYERQVEECKKQYSMYDTHKLDLECQKAIEKVQLWMKNGEIE